MGGFLFSNHFSSFPYHQSPIRLNESQSLQQKDPIPLTNHDLHKNIILNQQSLEVLSHEQIVANNYSQQISSFFTTFQPQNKVIYGKFKILCSNITNEKIQQYKISFKNISDFKIYLVSYFWRKNILQSHNLPLVKTTNLFIYEQSKKILKDSLTKFITCSFNPKIYCKVYIQNIILRLCHIKDIPFPENLYVLRQVLKGFQLIYQNIGYIKPFQDLICVNRKGQVKVWINSDFSKNYPNIQNIDDNISSPKQQSKLINQLLQIVINNTDSTNQPISFIVYLKQNHINLQFITFQKILLMISKFQIQYSITIPQLFLSVVEVLNQEEEQYDTFWTEIEVGQQKESIKSQNKINAVFNSINPSQLKSVPRHRASSNQQTKKLNQKKKSKTLKAQSLKLAKNDHSFSLSVIDTKSKVLQSQINRLSRVPNPQDSLHKQVNLNFHESNKDNSKLNFTDMQYNIQKDNIKQEEIIYKEILSQQAIQQSCSKQSKLNNIQNQFKNPQLKHKNKSFQFHQIQSNNQIQFHHNHYHSSYTINNNKTSPDFQKQKFLRHSSNGNQQYETQLGGLSATKQELDQMIEIDKYFEAEIIKEQHEKLKLSSIHQSKNSLLSQSYSLPNKSQQIFLASHKDFPLFHSNQIYPNTQILFTNPPQNKKSESHPLSMNEGNSLHRVLSLDNYQTTKENDFKMHASNRLPQPRFSFPDLVPSNNTLQNLKDMKNINELNKAGSQEKNFIQLQHFKLSQNNLKQSLSNEPVSHHHLTIQQLPTQLKIQALPIINQHQNSFNLNNLGNKMLPTQINFLPSKVISSLSINQSIYPINAPSYPALKSSIQSFSHKTKTKPKFNFNIKSSQHRQNVSIKQFQQSYQHGISNNSLAVSIPIENSGSKKSNETFNLLNATNNAISAYVQSQQLSSRKYFDNQIGLQNDSKLSIVQYSYVKNPEYFQQLSKPCRNQKYKLQQHQIQQRSCEQSLEKLSIESSEINNNQNNHIENTTNLPLICRYSSSKNKPHNAETSSIIPIPEENLGEYYNSQFLTNNNQDPLVIREQSESNQFKTQNDQLQNHMLNTSKAKNSQPYHKNKISEIKIIQSERNEFSDLQNVQESNEKSQPEPPLLIHAQNRQFLSDQGSPFIYQAQKSSSSFYNNKLSPNIKIKFRTQLQSMSGQSDQLNKQFIKNQFQTSLRQQSCIQGQNHHKNQQIIKIPIEQKLNLKSSYSIMINSQMINSQKIYCSQQAQSEFPIKCLDTFDEKKISGLKKFMNHDIDLNSQFLGSKLQLKSQVDSTYNNYGKWKDNQNIVQVQNNKFQKLNHQIKNISLNQNHRELNHEEDFHCNKFNNIQINYPGKHRNIKQLVKSNIEDPKILFNQEILRNIDCQKEQSKNYIKFQPERRIDSKSMNQYNQQNFQSIRSDIQLI